MRAWLPEPINLDAIKERNKPPCARHKKPDRRPFREVRCTVTIDSIDAGLSESAATVKRVRIVTLDGNKVLVVQADNKSITDFV
jgi:hypothetical protein